jgi:hypothetical protein
MAISYTWDVSNVDTYPSHTDGSSNTESDVIYNVHWRLKGSDDANNDADGNPQTAEVYGSQSLDVSDLSSFTAFDSVTLLDVQGWVEAAIGSDEVTALKAGIDAQIAEKITPSSVNRTIS